jgi:hypothetical protein
MEAMTKTNKGARKALDRLTNTLAVEILGASDQEVLREFQDLHGDPFRHAAEMRDLFQRTVFRANKARLVAAKAGAAARRAEAVNTRPVNIAEARRLLRAVLDTPNAPLPLRLAARKESELSDADVAGMIDDLRELGLPVPDPTAEE